MNEGERRADRYAGGAGEHSWHFAAFLVKFGLGVSRQCMRSWVEGWWWTGPCVVSITLERWFELASLRRGQGGLASLCKWSLRGPSITWVVSWPDVHKLNQTPDKRQWGLPCGIPGVSPSKLLVLWKSKQDRGAVPATETKVTDY